MKRLRLIVCTLALVCAAALVTAAGASARTHKAAEETAVNYASIHFNKPGPAVFGCTESGKNKKGEAQWYCYGYFESEPSHKDQWKVNVGPYGEVTYAKE